MALERVAVVGAGLAGLSAALELLEAGTHVDLFERSRLLGGRATSFDVAGHEVDNGQHVFLACCTEFIRFAGRVGMADALVLQDRFDARVRSRDGGASRLRAGILPAPFALLESFVSYKYLTAGDKLRIARALAAANDRCGDITFDAWLDRRGQNPNTRRAFWDPFFIPALNAPFDRVSAEDALFVLKTAFMRDAAAARFGFSRVPLAHLAQAAAARLDAVHLASAVVGIELDVGAGVRVKLLDGNELSFNAVVLAVPPAQVDRLLAGSARRHGIENLAEYDPYPIVDIHLWHDGGALGFGFAAALESPLQWIFEKAPGYLCCSCSAADEYMHLPTAQLEALAWGEVQAFLPELRKARRTGSAVTRNPEATWLARVGVSRTGQATASPHLAIAGGWTDTGWPDTMESAVRSGSIAARILLANAASSHEPVVPVDRYQSVES